VSQSLDSFSDSSGSVSDSLGSFSDSSASSSGSSGDDTAYRNDVREYTVAYLRDHVGAEGSPEALRLGISEVALTRGITNWEALPSTFLAVGAGFAEAGLTLAEAEPYRNALAPPDSASAQSMIEGHSRVRIPSVAGDANSPDDDL
jgi:hypothetical protein